MMKKDLSVLVVEDSPADAELMVLRLTEEGLKTEWRRVEKEQEYLDALAHEPDVILADWALPSFSGKKALSLLKECGLDIPFIMVTGSIGEEAAAEAMKTGAYDLVLKDRLGRLGAAVRRAVEEKTTRIEKRVVEERLRESDRRFRGIFNSINDSIFILDLEGGIIEANETAAISLGYSRNELLGMASSEIDSSCQTPLPFERIERIRKAGSLIFQSIYRRKDGSVFPVEVHGRIFEYRGKQSVLGIARDITERKRIEKELQESRQKLANLMNNLQGMVYSCLNDKDWTMTFVSRGCIDLTGYMPEELLNNRVISYNDLIHPEDRQYVWDEVQAAVEAGRPYELEYRIIARDGTSKWVWEKGCGIFDEACGLLSLEGLINDISAEKKIREERERLIAAVEQSGEAIILTDTGPEIVYVNPAFERVTGYTREEAIGRNPRMLKSGKQDQAFYKELWDTISSGGTFKCRMVNRKKSGDLYTEEATISPVTDSSGKIINYVAVKRDITAQLELEERFSQAQKMESIGRLAGGVAHDFNNMLGVIIGQAELALDEPGIDQRLQAGLLEIRKAAERSANLTRQLLAFARKQPISPRLIDLNGAVEGLLKMLRRLIGENILLTWLPSSSLWPVKMDSSQVDQILANLCVNSRDAIGGSGNITIRTANYTFDDIFCKSHKEFRPGKYVCLAVSDDGCGMDERTVEHLFEPFFTTKELGRGTGLGLATVYGIVNQNRGFIIVDSLPGKGTTFEIYIPSHEGQLAAQEADEPRPAEKGRGETVMVVEDDPSLLLLISRILKGLGYKILSAVSGKPALALAESRQGPIHLLISDVIMPGMDGRDLAQRLRATRPNIKVLFVSGYPADILARQGIMDEGFSFLPKPFSPARLASKVREALEAGEKKTGKNYSSSLRNTDTPIPGEGDK